MLRKHISYGKAMQIPNLYRTNTCPPLPPLPPLSVRLSLNSAMGIEHGADDAFGRQRCLSLVSLHDKLNTPMRHFCINLCPPPSLSYNSNRLYWHTLDKAEI